jgi:hypothetical protein
MIKTAFLLQLVASLIVTHAAKQGLKGSSTPRPASKTSVSIKNNTVGGEKEVNSKASTISAYDLASRTSMSFVGLLPAVVARNSTKCSVNVSYFQTQV